MSVDLMRQELYDYYKKRGWRPGKVNYMPDKQVVAIYHNYSNKGFPLPKAKERKEWLVSEPYEQLSLW